MVSMARGMGARTRRIAIALATVGRSAVLPGLSVVVALGLLVYGQFGEVPSLASALSAAALLAGTLRAVQLYREASALVRSSRAVSTIDALTGLPNRTALIADIEETLRSGRPRTLVLFDLDGFKQYNDCFGRAAGDGLLRRLAFGFENMVSGHGRAYRLGGDEFCALFNHEADTGDPIVAAAAAMLLDDTGLFNVTNAYGCLVLPGAVTTASEAVKLVDHRLYAHKHAREGLGASHARDVLLTVLEFREPDLHRHMQEVAELAREVGRRIGLDAEELDIVGRAAELHDVGKVAVPDAILSKVGALDDEEWAFIRRHTLIGERIVGASPPLRAVARLVRSSHERWDGRGYPDGLAGEDIPMGSRIILACDAFDAMISDHSYKAAIDVSAALEELEHHAGRQFDPTVVRTLVAIVRERARVAGEGFEPSKA